MDVGKYECFLKVAELGNLTRAAEELGYTQSAVSRIVADLERTWKMTLLTRGKGGVALTPAGMAIVPHLRAVCHENQRLIQAVAGLHGLTTGTIRVGTFNSFSVHRLPRMMKSFLALYPGIQFEVLTHIEYRKIEDWVASGRVDCGFIALPATQPLETVFLLRDEQRAVVPMDHPLAGAACYPLERFAQDSFIHLEDDRDREITRIFEARHIQPNTRYTVNDDYAAISMVENGLGVSVLTELVLQRTPYQVVSLPLDHPHFRDVGMAVRSYQGLTPAAARFLSFVQEWTQTSR